MTIVGVMGSFFLTFVGQGQSLWVYEPMFLSLIYESMFLSLIYEPMFLSLIYESMFLSLTARLGTNCARLASVGAHRHL